MLRCYRIVVVTVLEVSGVLQIALDYVSYTIIGWDLVQLDPAHLLVRQEGESRERQWLALCSGK